MIDQERHGIIIQRAAKSFTARKRFIGNCRDEIFGIKCEAGEAGLTLYTEGFALREWGLASKADRPVSRTWAAGGRLEF